MSGTKSAKSTPSAKTPSAKPASSSKGASKTPKPSKVVKLKLSPEKLSRFTTSPTSSKTSKSKSSALSTSPETPVVKSASPSDIKSESNSTPAPDGTPAPDTDTPLADGSKKKGLSGPKPGTKRGSGVLTEGLPKAKGKPGPKKKPRLDDGTIDNNDANGNGKVIKSSLSTVTPLATHKLGPKANQGAINAGLRALDRTGKPCRKWERKGFQIKSFTGVIWQLPSWKTPKTKIININGNINGESDKTASSDTKVQGSSAVDSEKSNSGMDLDAAQTASNGASSPVTAVAITA
ncbi:MAG: hypothetical protein M1812_003568 [Candelaria pacifica]|nr:MAG: hypothetical protein M1812_003568 [Candelaria pacifica]